MDFDLSDDQRQMADSLRRYLEDRYDFDHRKAVLADTGHDAQLWAGLADLGLFWMGISEPAGGMGGGAVDLMTPFEAIGQALLTEPVLPCLLAGRLVDRLDPDPAAVLGPVMAGTRRLALAWLEDGGRWQADHVATRARPDGAGWRISGTKRAVVGAPLADDLIVTARTDAGLSLFVVARADAALAPARMIDNRLSADLTLASAPARLLGSDGGALDALEDALDFAAALSCAEAVGVMDFTVATTVEYLKTRKQFGVPLSSFQALQHRCVDMAMAADQARSMAILACARVDEGQAEPRARAVSAAKIVIGDACRLIAQDAVQMHGGIGMTEELKVSHAFRRLTSLAEEFGDTTHHLARFTCLDA